MLSLADPYCTLLSRKKNAGKAISGSKFREIHVSIQ